MIRELLKKLRAKLKFGSTEDGRLKSVDPSAALKINYRDLLQLAKQIESHAERAPYPHVAEILRQMAREKQASANALKEKIPALQETEVPHLAISTGKNHWERMVQDLEDQKVFEENFLQLANFIAEERPEISHFLREIVIRQAPHKEKLLDLIARADPQAHLY
ncbi:MAG: hypothetical protein HYY46_06930 [Deltaproteobacteria bacterium]|nr:hypothetical protein [Deltaproteobacteria bacterium]